MGSRAFCDTRTGGDAHWVCTGLHSRDERTKPGEAPQDAPHDVLGRRDAVGGTPSLCQEPSETDAGTSTLVGNAPLSVQNRTNLPDTLIGNLQQWLIGTYHGVSRAQLQVYLDEFVFRHNRRQTPMAAFQTLLGLGTQHAPTVYARISGARDLEKPQDDRHPNS